MAARRVYLSTWGLLTVLACSTARCEDWPQFRGPTAQGLSGEKGLPTQWSPTRNIAWKREIAGDGWSSPVVHGDRVFLTSAVALPRDGKNRYSLRAVSLDVRAGKVLWDVEVFRQDPKRARGIHNKNSHASPTPITDGKRLWVHFGTNGTACLDTDGKVLWKNLELRYAPVHGSGASPAIVDGVLIVSCDGADGPFVVGIDASTGETRWRTPRPESTGKQFAFCTPLAFDHGGRRQVFVPGANWAASYDPGSGKELWRVRHGGYSVVPRPVYGHGLVYFSSSFDRASFIAVKPDGTGDVSDTHVAWRETKGAPHSPSPLLVGDEIYFVSDRGVASCVAARTGKRHWQGRLGGGYSASPVHADGKIYFQSERGEGVVVRAGTEFEVLARNDLGERSLASYAVSGGAIFIRTQKHLWCVRKGR